MWQRKDSIFSDWWPLVFSSCKKPLYLTIRVIRIWKNLTWEFIVSDYVARDSTWGNEKKILPNNHCLVFSWPPFVIPPYGELIFQVDIFRILIADLVPSQYIAAQSSFLFPKFKVEQSKMHKSIKNLGKLNFSVVFWIFDCIPIRIF